MSRKRPRIRAAESTPASRHSRALKTTTGYWNRRLFRSTFTYKGSRRETSNWVVKIQHGGMRKTWTLGSPSRKLAALEAFELYRTIVNEGWQAAMEKRRSRLGSLVPAQRRSDPLLRVKLEAAYWQPRLIARKYTEFLHDPERRELSALVEHNGIAHHCPLGSALPHVAARKAAELYRTVIYKGWEQAKLVYSREFTVGVFWSMNPFACTYTTLITLPANEPIPPLPPVAAPRLGRRFMLVLLEPDGGVRRALTWWLGRQSMMQWTVRAAPGWNAGEETNWRGVSLVLVNHLLAGGRSIELIRHVQECCPGLPVYSYGIFEDSDHIFASLSGIGAGYMLRRRPPTGLLEPFGQPGSARPPTDKLVTSQVRQYFQSLFEFAYAKDDAPGGAPLTDREQEILDHLSRGLQDKEIADRLGISAWTVHSHLKNIFEKYGVHSRTEAVVKYLHK